MAFLAAILKSLTIPGSSSVVRRRGGVCSIYPRPLARGVGGSGLSVEEMGACPFG